MHGLINRSMQFFLRDNYGPEAWMQIVRRAELPVSGFEAMLHYDDALTMRMLGAAAAILAKQPESLLEDLGVHLVANPESETVRRLLRFGGETYVDFLHSLDDLQERARLAVPDLEMPRLTLTELSDQRFTLSCSFPLPGAGWVLVGLLRAMGDDYGALVMLDHAGAQGGIERIDIHLADEDFADGRDFALFAGAGAP